VKTLQIILKEIKRNIRDYKANTMMVLFPIVLIIILGAAFSGIFKGGMDLGGMSVLYTIDAEDSDPVFESAFNSFRQHLSGEMGLVFEETTDFDKGLRDIEDNKYAAYLHITGDPLRIDMYKNKTRSVTSGIVENAVAAFIDSYVTINVAARNNPAVLSELQADDADYVRIRSLDRKRQPGATDYYAIAMLTLILLYSSQTGFWGIRSEIEGRTAARILCAPVYKYQYLTGKILGSIFVTIVQGFIVLMFSKLVLKAYWGEDLLTVAVLVITYSVMAVSLGAALAFVLRSGEAANGLLNTIIPILVFLGGGYVPVYVMGDSFSKLSVISPVRWINSALLNLIYDGNYSDVPISIAINLGLSVLFISVAVLLSGKGRKAYA
jgi:ABC-2 type transport system permease protein